MVRYYTVQREGQIRAIILQDDSGIYCAVPEDGDWRRPVVYRAEPPGLRWARLPEWPDAREVATTSPEYLEFKNRTETGSYAGVTHSAIGAEEGSIEDAVRTMAGRIALGPVLVASLP